MTKKNAPLENSAQPDRFVAGPMRDVGAPGGVHEDRVDIRTEASDREYSEEERLEMFRMGMFNDVLPNLPKIPGYRTIWLTTTNPRDTIQGRMRLGYEPVRPGDVPGLNGLDQLTAKSGQWEGFISCNEMLAFKLPESLYKRYMTEAHHDAPAREDMKIVDVHNRLQGEADSVGSRVDVGDGLDRIKHAAAQRPLID